MAEFTHAGGVVVRILDCSERRYLLARSSKDPGHWVLPKGHIDPGEAPEQTALREVREETGVTAEIVERLGTDTYVLPEEEVRALYFAMRFVSAGPADEDRATRWCTYEEALATISFEGARELIQRAHETRI